MLSAFHDRLWSEELEGSGQAKGPLAGDAGEGFRWGVREGRTGVTLLKSARTEMAPSGAQSNRCAMECHAEALNVV